MDRNILRLFSGVLFGLVGLVLLSIDIFIRIRGIISQ